MKIIDSHTHPFGNIKADLKGKIKSRRDAVLLRLTDPALFAQVWDSTDDLSDWLLADMDENGIDQALIQSPPGGRADFFSDSIARHPDRLVGICSVNQGVFHQYDGKDAASRLSVTNAALGSFEETLAFQVKKLGYRGIGEGVNYVFSQSTTPDDVARDLMPVMELIDRYRIPVMFSTAWNQFGKPIHKGIPYFVDDLAIAFPNVPIILTKMGRGYDFIFEVCLCIAFKHLNVYLDTVQAPARHIARSVEEIGANRVLFGSDWDRTWRELGSADGKSNIYRNALNVLHEARLSDTDKEWVLGRTAAELYGLRL